MFTINGIRPRRLRRIVVAAAAVIITAGVAAGVAPWVTLTVALTVIGVLVGWHAAREHARLEAIQRHPSFITGQIDAMPAWPVDEVPGMLSDWRDGIR